MTDFMAAEQAVIRSLAEYTRELCGHSAIVNEFNLRDSPIVVVEVQPRTAGALALSIVGEQFLNVSAGKGGRWELGYSHEDVRHARRVIEAVVRGRVEEHVNGKGTSLVIELDDGSMESTSVAEGCLSLFIPRGVRKGRAPIRRFQAY
ncbi:MAG TPA: hypothetical protein VF000_09635 [Agromyces sp.]